MGAEQKSPLNEDELNATWVFDSVYNPIATPLLKMAQAKGCGTISGVEMFLHQAARQFEIWTNKPVPLDAMRQVLLRQLGASGADGTAAVATVVPPKGRGMAITADAAGDGESGEEPEEAAEEKSSAQPAGPKGAAAKPTKSISAKPEAKTAAAKSAAAKPVAAKAAGAKTSPVKTAKKATVRSAAKAPEKAKKPAAKKAVKAKGR